jgi:hypothetical protein
MISRSDFVISPAWAPCALATGAGRLNANQIIKRALSSLLRNSLKEGMHS